MTIKHPAFPVIGLFPWPIRSRRTIYYLKLYSEHRMKCKGLNICIKEIFSVFSSGPSFWASSSHDLRARLSPAGDFWKREFIHETLTKAPHNHNYVLLYSIACGEMMHLPHKAYVWKPVQYDLFYLIHHLCLSGWCSI